jgi:mRNA interferase RelE/StbE
MDVWRYELTAAAEHDIRRLPAQMRRRVFAALDSYVASGGQGDVRKLAGTDDEYRLRVGEWRVRFILETVSEAAEPPATGAVRVHVATVLHVLPRGRAYRDR